MRKEKINKKELCQKSKKINIIVKGSDKVLKSKTKGTFEDKKEIRGGEELVTLKQIVRLIKALKEKSHTLDEIIEILEHMANDTN